MTQKRFVVALAVASLAAGCSTGPSGGSGSSSYSDGYTYGSSYWPNAKNNGLSYSQECAALTANAPGDDNLDQWESGCVAAGKALVTDDNP